MTRSKAVADAAPDKEAALVNQLRAALPSKGLTEQRMFGGICFMLNGNMLAAVSKRGLLFRVGKEHYDEALARPGAAPMEMRGREMEGYVRVAPDGLDEVALHDWLQLARSFVEMLPPKAKAEQPQRKPK